VADIYHAFHESVRKGVDAFDKWDRHAMIRVVSHIDADGICACSLLVKALMRLQRRYSVTLLPQLNEACLKDLSTESHTHYIFTDLGSGQLPLIKQYLPDRNILILDHHELPDTGDGTVIHINPHKNGIDGSKEIAGAGVVYTFIKALDPQNSLILL